MISNAAVVFFALAIVAMSTFVIWSLSGGRRLKLLNKLYCCLCLALITWSAGVLSLRFTPADSEFWLYFWDAFTYLGVSYSPVLMLLIAIAFTHGLEKLPPRLWLLLIMPTLTNIVVWTNPLHHWHYVVFSVFRDQLVFGPYIIISGAYNYLCLLAGAFLMIRFAVRNPSRLYVMQSAFFVLGLLVPLTVSIVATLGLAELTIAATPVSFAVTLICSYVAINRLHMLDIRPVATQRILDWIPDSYLVLSAEGLVLDYNRPFRDNFGRLYRVQENTFLRDCLSEGDAVAKTPLYNLLTTITACGESQSGISYEQSVSLPTAEGEFSKLYYIVEVTPLIIRSELSGFVVIFKDITQVKRSMQQLADSQTRMMEQERLAFLGQMVGGLAHNLKTPIMSISGCAVAIENLLNECDSSLADSEVTAEDYREIYGEMRDWLDKTRESCAYMSDIITAIKGQAVNAGGTMKAAFTLDDLIRRSTLLMRHELQSGGCSLAADYDRAETITMNGDINNLIQILNNLITNAIDAMRPQGGLIRIGAERTATELEIYVKDNGPGIPPRVRQRLFKEMITSKGVRGTGLGLFISQAVVRGKFGGHMWARDNPEGGAIIGFSLPLAGLSIRPAGEGRGEAGGDIPADYDAIDSVSDNNPGRPDKPGHNIRLQASDRKEDKR